MSQFLLKLNVKASFAAQLAVQRHIHGVLSINPSRRFVTAKNDMVNGDSSAATKPTVKDDGSKADEIGSESFCTKAKWACRKMSEPPSHFSEFSELLITTSNSIKGRTICEELGVVVGTSARSRNILQDLWARVMRLFGGQIPGYKELFTNTAAEATAHAMEEAQTLGATSIIHLRYEIATTETRFSGVSCFVICYGTAVKCATTCHHNRDTGHPASAQPSS